MILVWLPEINKLWSDPDAAWTVFLIIQELLKAVVCVYFVRNVFGYCGAVWFVTQAIDEVTNGNFWGPTSYWEYGAFALLALSAYLFNRYR